MSGDEQFVTVPGTRFIVLAKDRIASRMAVERGTLLIEPTVGDIARQIGMSRGSVVLDIGAFIGYVSRSLLDAGYVVHAFEPQLDAFQCLAHNCPEAILYNVAVGDGRNVSLTSIPFENDNCGARLVRADENGTPTVRIDDLQLSRVDFVKIDVEGFEPAVLMGMQETMRRFHPPILFEVYPAMMREHGFSVGDMAAAVPDFYIWNVVVGSVTDVRYDVLARLPGDLNHSRSG